MTDSPLNKDSRPAPSQRKYKALPPRALVIDDSEIARAQISETLEEKGIQVFQQPSAIGASRTILRNKIPAVIVDVSMPGLSGDRLVGVLRQNARLGKLFIIVLSARSDDELQELRRTVDADAFVSKANMHIELLPTLRSGAANWANFEQEQEAKHG